MLWKEDIIDTSATYSGQPGHSYSFYSIAMDHVGHVESAPSAPDASIFVLLSNTAPVAADDAYTLDEDALLTLSAPGVLGNDTDSESDPLTANLVTAPTHGSLTFNTDGSFTYTPAADYFGSDSFTYKVNDGTADSNAATVSLTITPVNDTPVTQSASFNMDEDIPSLGSVVATDADSGPLTFFVAQDGSPARGSLALNLDGFFTYTPDKDYYGTDSFIYMANDGSADSNTATVTININPVNDAPVAVNDSYSTDEDTPLNVSITGVLGNDTDVENDPLTAMLVASPAHGTLTFNTDGSFSYTPNLNFNGSDSFTYKANDSQA